MQRVSFQHLKKSDLIVDAVYEGGRSGNAGDDPLTRLIGVSNQGGFRYLGRKESPRLIVLTSTFDDPDWPDSLDRETGILSLTTAITSVLGGPFTKHRGTGTSCCAICSTLCTRMEGRGFHRF